MSTLRQTRLAQTCFAQSQDADNERDVWTAPRATADTPGATLPAEADYDAAAADRRARAIRIALQLKRATL